MKKILLLTIAILAISVTANADEKSTLAAAEHLFEVSGIKDSMKKSQLAVIDSMSKTIADSMVKQTPCLKDNKNLADGFKSVMLKTISFDETSKYIVDLYAQTFTEKELNDLAVFYQTPLGQKVISKQPEIMHDALQHGTTLVQQRMPQLQASIKDLMSKYVDEKGQCKAQPK